MQAQRIGYLFGLLLFAYFMVFIITEGVCSYKLIGRKIPGLGVGPMGVVGQYTMPNWPGFKAGMQFPFVIVEANDKRLTSLNPLLKLINERPAGYEIKYKYFKGYGKPALEVMIATADYKILDFFLGYIVPGFTCFIFLLCGALVFLLRPNTSTSWGILLFCSLIIPVIMPGAGIYYLPGPKWLVWSSFYLTLFCGFFGSYLFHFCLTVFDEPDFFKDKLCFF